MKWQTRVQKALQQREQMFREGVVRHGRFEHAQGLVQGGEIVMRQAENAYGKGEDRQAEVLRSAARSLRDAARGYPR